MSINIGSTVCMEAGMLDKVKTYGTVKDVLPGGVLVHWHNAPIPDVWMPRIILSESNIPEDITDVPRRELNPEENAAYQAIQAFVDAAKNMIRLGLDVPLQLFVEPQTQKNQEPGFSVGGSSSWA